VDFLLVLVELLSLCVTAEALRANIGSKSAISLQWGPADPNVQVEGSHPTNHSFQKSRLHAFSYGVKIWTDLSFVLSQCMRLTDGQMDNQTEFCGLHSMQRSKNRFICANGIKLNRNLLF